MTLDRDTLSRAAERVIDITKTDVLPTLAPNEDILPILFRLDDDGEIIVAPTPLTRLMNQCPTPEHRRALHEAIAMSLRLTHVRGYVALYMGWSISGKEWDGTRPSQSPNREETLVLSAGSDTACLSRIFEAKRDEAGRLVDLVQRDEDGTASGLFVDMLGSTTHTVH